jgi:hypothetical protein
MSNNTEDNNTANILSQLTDDERKKLRRQRFILDSGSTIESIKVLMK